MEWYNGLRTYMPSAEDDGRSVEIMVTDEMKRPGKLVRGFDQVWRIVFDNEMKAELVSLPRWRFT